MSRAQAVQQFIPDARVFTDPVRTFAYGTDASFYRLNPKMVIKVHNEGEVARLLPLARKHAVPVTFRAAGTSLSGQALTDSVLLKISHSGKNWRGYKIHVRFLPRSEPRMRGVGTACTIQPRAGVEDAAGAGRRRGRVQGDGSQITVQPGLIGGEVNRILQHHHRTARTATQYKIGPDPSSIDSCMIGGIVANNSSGMCCGVSQNTYHTLRDARIVFADGTVLDTADAASRRRFEVSHAGLLRGVSELAQRVQVRRRARARPCCAPPCPPTVCR